MKLSGLRNSHAIHTPRCWTRILNRDAPAKPPRVRKHTPRQHRATQRGTETVASEASAETVVPSTRGANETSTAARPIFITMSIRGGKIPATSSILRGIRVLRAGPRGPDLGVYELRNSAPSGGRARDRMPNPGFLGGKRMAGQESNLHATERQVVVTRCRLLRI